MSERSVAELQSILMGIEKIFFKKFPGDFFTQISAVMTYIKQKGPEISDVAIKQEIYKIHDGFSQNIENISDSYNEIFRKNYKEKINKIIQEYKERQQNSNKPEDKFDVAFSAMGLSLLDDTQVESQVVAKNLELKLIEKIGEALGDLNTRMLFLTRSELNLFSPETTTQALSAAIHKVITEQRSAKIACELFRDVLAEDFKSAYQEINKFLISKGVITDIKAYKKSLQHRETNVAGFDKKELEQDLGTDFAQQAGLGQGQGIGNSENNAGQRNIPAGGFPPISPEEMQQIVGSFGEIMRNAPAWSDIAANMSDEQLKEEINTSSYLQNTQNMQVLRNIQHNVVQQMPQPQFIERVDEAGIISQESSFQTTNVLKDIKKEEIFEANTIDQMVFDLTTLVFDKIFEQEKLPDHLKYLIGKLQIPILKEALKNKQFFISSEVPVRKFLDFLATSEVIYNQKFLEPVEKIINEILEKDDLNQEAFIESLDKLNKIIDEEHEKEEQIVEEVQPELKKEELMHLYYDQVISKLENSIQNAKFEPVKAFIEKIWAKLLVRKWFDKITEHKGNFFASAPATATAEFNATLAWFDILIWSTNLHNPNNENIDKLKKFLPAIGNGLKKVCANMGIQKPLETKLFNILAEKHMSLIKNNLDQVKERINKESEKIVADYKKTEEEDGMVSSKDLRKELNEEGIEFDNIFTKGSWFSLINRRSDDRKEKIKVKLLWVSPQKHVYLFSNPHKKFNKQLSKSQVWRRYKHKEIKPIEAPEWDSQKIIDTSIGILKTKKKS